MELSFEHALEPGEVRRRLELLAGQHDITLSAADEASGELVKKTLMGTVRARYRIAAVRLDVEVTQRPGTVPEGMLRRLLEDELGRALE